MPAPAVARAAATWCRHVEVKRTLAWSAFVAASLAASGARAGDLYHPSPPRHGGEEPDSALGGAFGLQGSVTRTRGSDRDFQVPSLTLAGARVGYGSERGFGVRVMNTFTLGGGVKGVEGGTTMSLSGGWRAPVAKEHGPILRGGIDGAFFGNKALSDLRLEAPQGHLGWQYLAHGKLAELVGKGGLVLVGWHHTGDAAERRVNLSPEVGALGSVIVPFFEMYVDYTHIFVRREGGPLDIVGMLLCGKAKPIVACTNVRVENGDVHLPSGLLANAQATYFGFLLGILRPQKD